MRKINPRIKILATKYINNKSPLECKCVGCGHIWASKWNDLSYGHGCPNCKHKSENEVRALFERLTGMKWPKANPSDVPWLHGLTLDGYCRELKGRKYPKGTAWERQGEQHYGLINFNGRKDTEESLLRRKRNDLRKRVQCWRHGVRLLCIPYKIRDVEKYIRNRIGV